MRKILVLNNDHSSNNKIYTLLRNQYETVFMNDLKKALDESKKQEFDAHFVEINEANSGLEFIKFLKSDNPSATNVFAIDEEKSLKPKIEALTLGVRDIFSSDMHQEEILLRLKNHLDSKDAKINRYKDLKVELATLSAYCEGQKLDLTLIEFKLLLFLIRRAGEIVSRDDLKDFTWPNSSVQDKTINTHLTNLRLKLGKTAVRVKSIKGEGVILV